MRLRLFLSFFLVVLVSVLGVVLIARQNVNVAVRSFMLRGGMVGTGSLAAALEDYYHQQGSWSGVESLLEQQGIVNGGGPGNMGRGMMRGMGGMNLQRLRLARENGDVLVDTAPVGAKRVLSASERMDAIPIVVDGRTVGYLLAEGGIGFNARDEFFLIRRLNAAARTASLIAGGLSLLLALALSYSLMRPVRELTQAARRLGEGDFSQRVEIKGDDELTLLASTFNHMADSLQEAEARRRSMTADVAHELRNPLAVQRANLEALQDGLYPLTPESLAPLLDQNLLLTRLVDDLRTLALAESGELKLERRAVDLTQVVQRSLERFRPQAELSHIDLAFEGIGAEQAIVQADPLRLEQILSNLLSNALRYTPGGGRVQVQVVKQSGQVEVRVADSGPGIPEGALDRIFERFYRVDASRSREGGGTGLGLAIAKKLAEEHGGSLQAANLPAGGAQFTLRLPLSG